MSLANFSAWLYETPVSVTIRDVSWIVPTVQSIHILAIAVIVGSAIVSDLRLAGVLATDETPRAVVQRYLPWMWRALLVLLMTGLVMLVGEPDRVIFNPMFWLKMALVLVAFALTLLFRRPLLHAAANAETRWQSSFVKPAAWLSLTVWVGVIFCGRWIAYMM